MARQSIHIRKAPPLGVQPGWTHKESFSDKGIEYRIDVENFRGINLKRF